MKQTPLAKRLRELRKSCNYSQEFVASHLDIIRQTYSHYETGRYVPNIEMLYKIANLYHISADSLLQLTHDTHTEPTDDTPNAFMPTVLLSSFLEYTNTPENDKKLKHLTLQEKLLLYYFHNLSTSEQEDLLTFMDIKVTKKGKQ